MDIRIDRPLLGQGEICAEVLVDIPEWFGIEQANEDYAEKAEQLPTFVATLNGEVVGFMSLLVHSPESAELYVLGVKKQFHRQGIG